MYGREFPVVEEKGRGVVLLVPSETHPDKAQELMFAKVEVECFQKADPPEEPEPVQPWGKEDITVTADVETVMIAMLQRVGNGGRLGFTANELARAKQHRLERRADGHKLELWIAKDT
jgi:hypothetical protein